MSSRFSNDNEPGFFVVDLSNYSDPWELLTEDDKQQVVVEVKQAVSGIPAHYLTPAFEREAERQLLKMMVQETARRRFKEHTEPKQKPLTLLDVFGDLADLPPATPLLGECLGENTLAVLLGKFGTLKTFLALDWACCVATGKAWQEHSPINPAGSPVLYVAAEGHIGVGKRLAAWQGENGIIPPGKFFLVPEAAPLTTDQGVQQLVDIIKARGIKLLVLDTLHKCCPGIEENSATEMGAVIGRLNALREDTGCTVLMAHHTGHAGTRARGSSSIEDDVDTSWLITLDDDDDRSPGASRTLSQRKSKDSEFQPQRSLKFLAVEGTDSGVLEIGEPDDSSSGSGSASKSDVRSAAVNAWFADLIGEMDDAGVPHNFGRSKTQAWFLARTPPIDLTDFKAAKLVGMRKEAHDGEETVGLVDTP